MISENQVREILASPASNRQIGDTMGIHRSTISAIRLGKMLKHLAPDVPRWSAHKRCDKCIHWLSNRCSFDFPDPIEEGLAVARDCLQFRGK